MVTQGAIKEKQANKAINVALQVLLTHKHKPDLADYVGQNVADNLTEDEQLAIHKAEKNIKANIEKVDTFLNEAKQ
jgi:pyrimidine operon attenuation protein/uracil phosphoribosyltransferase